MQRVRPMRHRRYCPPDSRRGANRAPRRSASTYKSLARGSHAMWLDRNPWCKDRAFIRFLQIFGELFLLLNNTCCLKVRNQALSERNLLPRRGGGHSAGRMCFIKIGHAPLGSERYMLRARKSNLLAECARPKRGRALWRRNGLPRGGEEHFADEMSAIKIEHIPFGSERCMLEARKGILREKGEELGRGRGIISMAPR